MYKRQDIQKKVHYKIKIPTKIRKRSWIILSSNNVNSTEANNYNINNVDNKKMNNKNSHNVVSIILHTIIKRKWLSLGIIISVCGAVVTALYPPLVLGKIVDTPVSYTHLDVYKRQADLFQISVDELLSNEKSEKKQSNYIYESRTEYDIDGKKNFDIKLGGAYAVDLKAYHGEKIEVAMFSNVYKNLPADYKVKIDDIKNRIDIDLNRFNEASEADAKESLVITIFIPVKYIGKIELSVNARTLNLSLIHI